jgi:hypothetical protein
VLLKPALPMLSSGILLMCTAVTAATVWLQLPCWAAQPSMLTLDSSATLAAATAVSEQRIRVRRLECNLLLSTSPAQC